MPPSKGAATVVVRSTEGSGGEEPKAAAVPQHHRGAVLASHAVRLFRETPHQDSWPQRAALRRASVPQDNLFFF